ncbi:hypothetical protein OIC43_01735 [Streptomyces sp. NBC_00825]|uniref:hypothetical protein n=1 Tax=unclassified Streptomyces TaxID=2593676 RepID=UPI0022553943|nr:MULTISPECIES: hypothetical protein [unclassified Streptomyces]WTB59247.1 hypothetical protein OG832_41990 [Streptomyces sp. NBC_00826]WTH87881.1 hypothetical protein OIC43_01735 [Streptomyces sp. NBC_00825]WTH96608.1 hypothetical protein OHA23_01735 [Streptomyces sp. NBC_00822]MCX4870084.1 hypothetical protein [Streptomyces sp. NBC_00906]MCX4901247.1 hypothetical protein [Streptomyces sp. NBC_00892]
MTDEITARAGREFYTFDGRILEVFGSHPRRFHIRNMDLRVTGPDRKGRRTVEIVAGSPEASAAQYTWHHSAEEWQRAQGLEALLEAVRAGIASAREYGA